MLDRSKLENKMDSRKKFHKWKEDVDLELEEYGYDPTQYESEPWRVMFSDGYEASDVLDYMERNFPQ